MNYETFVPDYIKKFQPYIPSKPDDELKKMFGCPVIHRLNNNENPLGPPSAAQEVIDSFPPVRSAIYPSGDSYFLRCALAEKFGIDPDQFLVGNGSNEVITSVIKAFCEKGDNIVTADKTFAVYEWVAEFSGFEARLVPLKEYTFDDEGILAAIDGKTKIIFICNPNNPTGTYWNRSKTESFLDKIDGRCIVVIDEAYFEYVEKEDYPDGMELMKKYPNVLVFRTFSKMYGMAGLRVGYVTGGPDLIDLVRRAYVVYSVNAIAQLAAVEAVRHADGHIAATNALMREGKDFLRRFCGEMKLPALLNEGSYAMIQAPMNDTLLYRKLLVHGMMVRTMTGFRFPNWIRVTIVEQQILAEFVVILKKILVSEKQVH